MRVLVLSILLLSTSARADVRVASPATPGRWVLLEVDAPAGEATLDGGAGVTTWPHRGGRIAVPALLPPDAPPVWTVRVSGEPNELPVAFEQPAEPTPLNAVMPRAYDAVQAWRPARPLRERVAVVGAAGAACALLAIVAVLARGSHASSEQQVAAEPAPRVAARPAPDARSGLRGYFGLRRVRSPRSRFVGITLSMLIAIACVAALAVWREKRPALATRTVAVTVAEGEPLTDIWQFHVAPTRDDDTPVELPVAGYTTPVAFSADHLRTLRPTLRCDADGVPQTLTLTLPPGGVAATVQRVEADTFPSETPDWASPLLRRVYRRR